MTSLSPNNPKSGYEDMQNNVLDTTVLELLASRICHDLISPVGAVHNGVEFLEEMGIESGAEAISLIAHSAQMAAARLQAFRMAYGAGGRDPNIKPEDVYKTFGDLINTDGKITQNWDPHASTAFGDKCPSGYCKILMGTLMLAQECLLKGGEISVTAGHNGQTLITATGLTPLIREQVDEALARTIIAENLDPRLVHPYEISVLAANYGFTIEITERTQEQVVFTMSYIRD